MKTFKQIDLILSCLLIVSFAIASAIYRDGTFIIGYFVVGAWQVISMIVHAYNHWFTQKGGVRLVYHWITFGSLLTMPIGSFFILLFTAPVMAVYYSYICYDEIAKMQRPLAALK